MSEPFAASPSLSLTALERMERICTRFEDAWKAGQQPKLEAYLGNSPEPERSALLRELLVLDLSYRRRRGEQPSPHEYLRRFPKSRDLIETVFGEVASAGKAAASAPQLPMSRAVSDRNLLFGILALQMDFIVRDQLIAAMNAWVLDKSKPLGAILVDQRALAADLRMLLEALVQEHLKLHDDDPAKSLAAVSSIKSMREELRQIPDAELHASLGHVAREARPEDDPFATQSYSVGTPTSSGLRFRILRPHAKGGLGQVYVAHDEELHREVALKEIQERHADHPESRARFLLEAGITGGLEHPGIVPVYGLGQYADGRPYYAMRFIKGDSLKDAIERFHKLTSTDFTDHTDKRKPAYLESAKSAKSVDHSSTVEFRRLLGRFIDVCNAIAYAHSRGVLHRDLKPGNVMLGKYGETLVVDWGLAKARGEGRGARGETEEQTLRPASAGGGAETQAGTTLGTPAFMSPEQAAGRLDLLGPASDVYSLGATLFCVLTGKAPFAWRHRLWRRVSMNTGVR